MPTTIFTADYLFISTVTAKPNPRKKSATHEPMLGPSTYLILGASLGQVAH